MDWDVVLKQIDLLIFQQTGRHLDDLQRAILIGVMDGKKYADIAKEYKCTTGHVKDEGYKLWQTLSDALREDINKLNFRTTIDRLGFANSENQIIGNPVQIGYLNVCTSQDTKNGVDDEGIDTQGLNPKDRNSLDADIAKTSLVAKPKTIVNLLKLGLTNEQIAEALDIPLSEVQSVADALG